MSNSTDPLQYGASKGVYSFYVVTTTAGNASITLIGGSFSAADVGKAITILGAGPNEQRLVTTIASVTSPTQITVASAPTQSMNAFSTVVYYGALNAVPINAAMAAGTRFARPAIMPPGIYMVEAPLQCNMVNYNNANAPQPFCIGTTGSGTSLMAVGAMAGSTPVAGTLFTIGGYANSGDFSQFIRNGNIEGQGLGIDCNMTANFGLGLPFFQDSTLGGFTVKNCLTANFHIGATGSPITSGGLHAHHNMSQRDTFEVTITNMTCVNAKPNITTNIDHGIASGRIVSIRNANNMPGAVPGISSEGPTQFIWDNTGPNTGILYGVDCTSWGAYTPNSGLMALTFPTNAIIHKPFQLTSGNPTTISISPGDIGLASGQTWCIYGIGGSTTPFELQTPAPDGCYTVTVTSLTGGDGPFQFTIPVDTTGFTYSGAGIVFRKMPLGSVGFYEDNTSDFEALQNFITGVMFGFYANPLSGGFDGKYTNNHFYNLSHGWAIAEHFLGGHNTLTGEQCDAPMVFCGEFSSGGNSSYGSELNATTFNWLGDDQTWLWRLDTCSGSNCGCSFCSVPIAEVSNMTVTGDHFFGHSATSRVNEVSNHALSGNPNWLSAIPNYISHGQQPGYAVLYSLLDSAVGTTKFTTQPPAPAGTTSTSLVAMGLGQYCNFIPLYKGGAQFIISGTISNDTLNDGALALLVYGQGTPLVNGASLSGSVGVGTQPGMLFTPSAGFRVPITLQGSVPETTLTLGSLYYIDAGLRSNTGGTATLSDVTCTVTEQ